jgi:hypothetical protein
MIEEFDQSRLERRGSFLESRANAHLAIENNRRWHIGCATTLLRDAAAIALMRDEFDRARDHLRQSGDLFIKLGFAAGLQLLYMAGSLDKIEGGDRNRIYEFGRAFSGRYFSEHAQPPELPRFEEDSFRAPQLLRAYQALAGQRGYYPEQVLLLEPIRRILRFNATMPVGPARVTMATYLATFDYLAKSEIESAEILPTHSVERVLGSFAQRREELLSAARHDRYHWQALLRPAELIDFDLLALLIAGVRHGQASTLMAGAFANRDSITALPYTLANALND